MVLEAVLERMEVEMVRFAVAVSKKDLPRLSVAEAVMVFETLVLNSVEEASKYTV